MILQQKAFFLTENIKPKLSLEKKKEKKTKNNMLIRNLSASENCSFSVFLGKVLFLLEKQKP